MTGSGKIRVRLKDSYQVNHMIGGFKKLLEDLFSRRLKQADNVPVVKKSRKPKGWKSKSTSISVVLPVVPQARQLPFYAPEFSWETFEGFFCDFLASHPDLGVGGANSNRVVLSSLYGRRGDSQHGIDIRAEMENGEVWVFQCKHYQKWGPQDTRNAIAACNYMAKKKVLLVTCSVSPLVREVINSEKDWILWDSDDISREFLARVSPDVAARILYTNFGPAWPTALLGLPGIGPLITPEAKFAPFLEESKTFHHRLRMVGRKEWLQKLDAFVEADRYRVFLLCGRGGIGKSRILREWSREFVSRHKNWTIRFVSDSPIDFAPSLDSTQKPLLLVFDDAHRLDDVRRVLFKELPSRGNIKLVLSLRPGPSDQVESELVEAGFDLTEIDKPTFLKPLSSDQALDLADEALGPLSNQFRIRLRDLSRDCPLLAVLAAELLKRNELADRDLENTNDFKILVFQGLLKEAKPVEDRFGSTKTNDLLRLIALLSPVKIDANFLKGAAEFLGEGVQANHVADILDALDGVGLILTTGAGVRITPDLLSDHLCFTACYDKYGHDTTFAGRVVTHFSSDQFPRLMQHLAEAEWRALARTDSAESVVEPLWVWFLERFKAGSFYARYQQLNQWANIAYLQPSRTLELVHLAVMLKDAPPPDRLWLLDREWNSHQGVLSALPPLLKSLGKNHPASVPACLDVLWEMGKDLPRSEIGLQNHPITVIGIIAEYQDGAFPAVQVESLKWIEDLVMSGRWTHSNNSKEWILTQMLNPFFGDHVEENWRSGKMFHWRSRPIHLENTSRFRKGALDICEHIINGKELLLVLACLGVLACAMRRARVTGCTLTDEFEMGWLKERREALKLLVKIRNDIDDSFVQYRLRSILVQIIQYDGTEFKGDCQLAFDAIIETQELNLLRAILGNQWSEFDPALRGYSGVRQEDGRRTWEALLNSVVFLISKEWSGGAKFLDYLRDLDVRLGGFEFKPRFSDLLQALAERHPALALEMVDALIQFPGNPLVCMFNTLVASPTAENLDSRLAYCEKALAVGEERLIAGVIECFTWWRRSLDLPMRAWVMVLEVAKSPSIVVGVAVTRFVHLNDNRPAAVDWDILIAIPIEADNWKISQDIIGCAGDLVAKGLIPTVDVIKKILSNLERVPALEGYDLVEGLSRLAVKFPGEVLMLLWRRCQLVREGEGELEALPQGLEDIDFGDFGSDAEVEKVVRELSLRLVGGADFDYREREILRVCVMQSGDIGSNVLMLLDLVENEDHLSRVVSFADERRSWPIVIQFPEFARGVLSKARELGDGCYSKIFRDMVSLPGPRGFNANEPDEQWKNMLNALEGLADKYKGDVELGKYFSAALKHERDWIGDMRRRGRDEDIELDDEI